MNSDPNETLEAARNAYKQGAWADATQLYLEADSSSELEAGDLDNLVWAAGIAARDADMLAALERLYNFHNAAENHEGSARAAFWSGLRNMMIGEVSLGAGWLQRAGKHAQMTPPDCVQRGFLILPRVFMARAKGDLEAAVSLAAEAVLVGEKCGDPDLIAMAGSIQGGLLFRLGRLEEGYVPIDEAMLLANAVKLSPVVTGAVYCEIVAACCRVLEMERAREWTEILNEWCSRNPQAKAFNGVCQVHRAEVLQLGGDWNEAFAESERAGEGLKGTTEQTAMATAAYRRGEIHRLRGNFEEAEAEYRLAGEIKIDPQPGLALLRLAQGRADEASSMIRRAVETAGDLPAKTALLPACIEILIAVDARDEAERRCAEFYEIAQTYGTEILARVSDLCRGSLAIANEDFADGVAALNRARAFWSAFGAPYLEARARVEIARGLEHLGDVESARVELEAAEKRFRQLGAAPDLARIDALRNDGDGSSSHSLTNRECEVLALLAEGGTNKDIADRLGLSPKTVNRHVENIFNKLGVSSRAAAVANGLKIGAI
ncbi:MAG: LuxR C-terminal-related transcriptional regulator [Paracoccaceae bacterium]|nr:LuxR C-terminal-related transcriptional regulator [Paracoccaceae bacterium]